MPKLPPTLDLAHLLIGQPELAEQLIRALAIKGRSPQFLDAGYSAQVLLDSMLQPEYRWLRRERLNTISFSLAAGGAGNFTQFEFALITGQPVGQVIAIVEEITLSNSNAAASSLMAVGLTALPTTVNFTGLVFGYRDDRTQLSSATPDGAYHLGGINTTANDPFPNSTDAYQVRVPFNSSFTFRFPFILTGRSILRMGDRVANSAVTCSISWRERAMLVSEAL